MIALKICEVDKIVKDGLIKIEMSDLFFIFLKSEFMKY